MSNTDVKGIIEGKIKNLTDEYEETVAKEFVHRMNTVYSFLYGHTEFNGDITEMSARFDDLMTTEHPHIADLVITYRGDFISSDREAAAFMMVYDSMKNLTAPTK